MFKKVNMGQARFFTMQSFPAFIVTKIFLVAVLLLQPNPCLGNPLRRSQRSVDSTGSGVYTVQVHQAFVVPFCQI